MSSIIFRHNNATHIICLWHSLLHLKMTNKTYEAHVPNIYMTHSHLLEHSKLALWHQQQRDSEANNYANTSHRVQMQKLSALLALTALTCQPRNQCRITVSVSLRQLDTILISAYAVLFTVQWARFHRLSWHRYICGSSSYFTETSWLALHKEKAGNNLMPQPCAWGNAMQTALYHYIASPTHQG